MRFKATCKIQGVSPYSQGRGYAKMFPKQNKEGHDQYEERTWRERCHYDKDGRIFIPGPAFHLGLISAAKFRGETIPGHGKKTYTKRFTSGVMILENPYVDPPTYKDEVAGKKVFQARSGQGQVVCGKSVFVPSTGNPSFEGGGGKRVWKTFPTMDEWGCTLVVYVVDPLIKEDVFRIHLEEVGMSIGIGTYRPQSRGTHGRFKVEEMTWEQA